MTPISSIDSTRSTRGGSRMRRFQTGSDAISRPTSSTTSIALSMSVPNATITFWLIRAQVRVRLLATLISPFGTVWTMPSRSRSVVRRRLKSSTVPLTPAIVDDVALAELVLDEDERAVQIVLDEALRPEPDGDPDDAEAGDGRPDVEPELAQDHERRRRRRRRTG